MRKKGTTKTRATKVKDLAVNDADDVTGGALLADGGQTLSSPGPLVQAQPASALSRENQTYTSISNALKTLQDTSTPSINNAR